MELVVGSTCQSSVLAELSDEHVKHKGHLVKEEEDEGKG
jgi:hypothetical protein